VITVIQHDVTVGQIDDLVYRLQDIEVAEGLLSEEYSLVLKHEDGFFVVGYDELPDDVQKTLDEGVFQIERPLWYWCSVDSIRDAVKDCLYRRWLHDIETRV